MLDLTVYQFHYHQGIKLPTTYLLVAPVRHPGTTWTWVKKDKCW